MAGIPISGLPVVVSSLLTDIFPAVQAGTTSQETLQQVMDLFGSNIQIGSPTQITGLGQAGFKAVSDNTKPSVASVAGATTLNHVAIFTDAAGTVGDSGQLFSNFALLTGAIFSGTVTLNGVQANPNDAATIGYVNSVATGLNIQQACYAGTTANLTATYSNGSSGVGATLTNSSTLAAFTTDGTSPPLNSRILVKNQSTAAQNGIYVLSTVGSGSVAWVLTRSTDYDQPAQINPGDLVVLNNGTTLALTSWLQTDTVTTIGTDPIAFTQFTTSPASLGQAAFKAVTDNTKASVASVSGSFTTNHILVAADTAGTIKDGGATSQFLLAANNLSDVANVQTSTRNIFSLVVVNSVNNILGTTFGSAWLCQGSSSYSLTFADHNGVNKYIDIYFETLSGAIVTLNAVSGNINGQSSISFGSGDAIRIFDDGTNYWIVAMNLAPVNFFAYRNASQSITNNTLTKVQYNGVLRNIGSFYDNVTNFRFNPKVPGFYTFNIKGIFQAATATGVSEEFYLYLNGSTILGTTHYTIPASNATMSQNVTGSTFMNGSTDYVEGYCFQNTGGAVNILGDAATSLVTTFQGQRISLY